MISDLVIDTNVFCHSHNPTNQYFQVSIEFLRNFLGSRTLLCVDENADLITEANNRSAIISEYKEHIPASSMAFQILVSLFSTGRVKQVSRTMSQQLNRKVRRLVSDKTDRIFLKIAINSDDMLLTSHDYADYSPDKRHRINREVNVTVYNAEETNALL